ncbi:MAG: hypothetical protein LBE67_09225 [Kocuria palustris]|nr:hypothetical protein [Kocuria palustris]
MGEAAGAAAVSRPLGTDQHSGQLGSALRHGPGSPCTASSVDGKQRRRPGRRQAPQTTKRPRPVP